MDTRLMPIVDIDYTTVRDYRDKNNTRVLHGDIIKFEDGTVWDVSLCGNCDDLGVLCNDYQCYPLYQFNRNEYEIINR